MSRKLTYRNIATRGRFNKAYFERSRPRKGVASLDKQTDIDIIKNGISA